MASEPKIGDVRPTSQGRRMWLGDGWYYVGAAENRLSRLLCEHEEMRAWLTAARLDWCPCCDADLLGGDEHTPTCRLAKHLK